VSNNNRKCILFLSQEAPWPAHCGAALRSFGILTELSKYYHVDLITLTRSPLTEEQRQVLGGMCLSVARARLLDATLKDRICILFKMILSRHPYHGAVLNLSIDHAPAIKNMVLEYPGIVFTSVGHFGVMIDEQNAPNWILNQCDADVEFWRVYANQAKSLPVRAAAHLNHFLARLHFPKIYNKVGRIISVCEEDRQHTLSLSPNTEVDVIENGIDCSYYVPDRSQGSHIPRVLFTGTSAARNMIALHTFVRNMWPKIRSSIADIELLVAGNFSKNAQNEFVAYRGIGFTGRVDDIRPYFNRSDVFIAPFQETHGSKLKIAEAMAMAMPIVTTPMGIRGFPLLDGESVVVARSNEEFAAKVIGLIKDPDRRRRLGDEARKVALEHIDWKVLGKRLHGIIEETFRGMNGP